MQTSAREIGLSRHPDPVAQAGSLLCRGLAIRKVLTGPKRLAIAQPAECHSAIQQITNLRYKASRPWRAAGIKSSDFPG
jgi:hypothetical protein